MTSSVTKTPEMVAKPSVVLIHTAFSSGNVAMQW